VYQALTNMILGLAFRWCQCLLLCFEM